jgi:uncharacterized protein YjgD (DUF1641 family)
MNQIESTIEFNEILSQLSKKENVEALLFIINSLPEISIAVKSIEDLSLFATSTLQDKQSLGELFDRAEAKMETVGLNKQTLDSIIGLIQWVPKVIPLLKNMVLGIEFISEIVKDQESVQFIMNELEPAVGKVKEAAGLLAQTNKRYVNDPSLPSISIFKLVSMLKEENVRKGYKYIQTFLTVLSENQTGRK